MRLWSIHPKYLDTQGLLAVWREGLLAKKVLENKTRGYKNHPQLTRFKECGDPISAINSFLLGIYCESQCRGFNFTRDKIGKGNLDNAISVSSGQLEYEFKHLLVKLKQREPEKYRQLKKAGEIKPHPLFFVVAGDVESWEKT